MEDEIDFHKTRDEVVSVEISFSPLISEFGETFGSIILIKDLTEIQSLRKEIARSQRMASLGRMAAACSMGISNPSGRILKLVIKTWKKTWISRTS